MMTQEKVLIMGATGLLGSSLVPYLRARGVNVVTHAHQRAADYNFDLTDQTQTFSALDAIQPGVVVNLVALTDIDACEEHCHLAYQVNVQTVENIVAWTQLGHKNFLIHISTDHVYDSPGVKLERQIQISNTYALTKYASEIVASKVPSTILRTNFFGRSQHPSRLSFSDWITRNLEEKREIKLFTDVYFSPLSMQTLQTMILLAIQRCCHGTYNLGSHEGMSKCDFALSLAKVFGLSTGTTQKIESTSFGFRAHRAKDMRMDSTLFEQTFHLKLPTLQEEIGRLGDL